MYFEVPQSRQRLIFIGTREDLNQEPSHPCAITRPLSVADGLEDVVIPSWEMDTALRTRQYAIASILRKMKEGDRYFSLERIRRNCPSPTILKRGGNHVRCLAHWSDLRVMTPTELARLGSFPDEFRFIKPGKNDDRDFEEIWARIGNSVPPLFMRAIARHIQTKILTSERIEAAVEATA